MACLLCCFIVLFANLPTYSQNSNCSNLGFEFGNFTNWIGETWIYSSSQPSSNTPRVTGFATRRHTIMSDTSARDANTGYALRTIPSGYKYSARLGDGFTSADARFRCWDQSLRYTMTIDSSNALLVMKFACVLQYASGHPGIVEPRFRLTLYDSIGNIIPDCSNYDVYSTNVYVKGFKTYIPPGTTTPVKWRDWTTVGANLLNYLGQTITVEFMAADCNGHFHYGYAYFLAECHPLTIDMKYCAGDSIANLTAPEGFERYSWTDKNGLVVDTMRFFQVLKPIGGETYSCTMLSATGCVVKLDATIAKFLPVAKFTSYMIDCKSNTVQFANLSTFTQGTLQFEWDFGDGRTSNEKNPRYTFLTSGLHPMTLIVKNPPSSCTDTLYKVVESFSPPLIGISGDSTYCPGKSVTIKAYGAYEYKWNIGSSADSLIISAPGGRYWLLGYSSTGCVSDTNYVTIGEEPDWDFISLSDTTLCEGFDTKLQVTGAANYRWYNNDTASFITVGEPGIYSVVGSNKRGCKKDRTFQVLEYPIPTSNFTTSVNTLDWKHNQLICTTIPQTDVLYTWNMGDGTIKTGTIVQHDYQISAANLQFTITQTARSIYDCADSTFQIIDVTPFVPNVFSPNGDGINDIFMADIELQVYDRNGLILYKGNTGWDGKYRGQPMEPDTYFYSVQYLDRNQHEQTKKGYITLVR